MRYFDNKAHNQMHARQWNVYVSNKYKCEIENSIKFSTIHDFTETKSASKDKINGSDTYIKYAGYDWIDPDNTLIRFDDTCITIDRSTTTDCLFSLNDKLEKKHKFNIPVNEVPKINIPREVLVFPKTSGRLAVLNFASFKNPGGMYFNGSSAQEESLCHESTLYPVLCANKEFYNENHRRINQGLYAHRVLYTPDIIFERDNKTVMADVITCAFPNLSAIWRRHIDLDLEYYKTVISHRIMSIMDSALIHGVDTIILGAIGCGVFKNDPTIVAHVFKETLNKYYMRTVQNIVFAIPDYSTYEIFSRVLYEYKIMGVDYLGNNINEENQ